LLILTTISGTVGGQLGQVSLYLDWSQRNGGRNAKGYARKSYIQLGLYYISTWFQTCSVSSEGCVK